MFILGLAKRLIVPLFSKAEFATLKIGKFKCLKCNKIFSFKIGGATSIHCTCSSSLEEINIASKLQKMDLHVIRNSRSILDKKELDIFIPKKGLAIEYNGLFWHSELYVDRLYHYTA